MFKSCKMYININILNNFVPYNTLKSKGSIDKFSVSSSRTEMIRGLGTLPFDNVYINRPILCLTNKLNGRIPE